MKKERFYIISYPDLPCLQSPIMVLFIDTWCLSHYTIEFSIPPSARSAEPFAWNRPDGNLCIW